MKTHRYFAAFFLSLWSWLTASTAVAMPDSTARQTLLVTGYDLSSTTINAFGKTFTRLSLRDGSLLPEQITNGIYHPSMPVKYVYIGIPENSRLSITAQSLAGETQTGVTVSPFTDTTSQALFQERYAQNPFYKPTFIPPTLWEIFDIFMSAINTSRKFKSQSCKPFPQKPN
jgi:hypothetical protein